MVQEPPKFEAAIHRAKVKRHIVEQLAKLPNEDTRREMLADLILELDGPPRNFAEAMLKHQTAQQLRPHIKPAVLPRGRPVGSFEGATEGRTAAVVAALRKEPHMSIADLTKAVYPEDPEGAKHKVRAILSSLKKQGRIKSVGVGKWEVVNK